MEGLDPQRRELLEARISGKFFSDQITASSSQMTGSSSGDTNDKTPEKTASTRGRKRKGAATPDDVSLKSGRSSNQDGRQITKYFGSRDLAKSSSQSGSLSASKNSTSRDLFQLESNSAYRTNKVVQTDLKANDIRALETKVSNGIESKKKDGTIDDLKREISQLEQQRNTHAVSCKMF